MARPRNDPDAEPTSERILRCAREAFSAQTYDDTSLASIAKAAGVRAPTILHHFESKEMLYQAVLREFYARLSVRLTQTLVPASQDDPSLTQAALAVLSNLEDHDRDLLVTIVAEVVHSGRGADVIASHVEPLLALFGPIADQELSYIKSSHRRATFLVSAMLVLFAEPSARTPPALERLRRLVWGESSDALSLARALIAPPGSD